MIDCREADRMIEICGMLDKSNSLLIHIYIYIYIYICKKSFFKLFL